MKIQKNKMILTILNKKVQAFLDILKENKVTKKLIYSSFEIIEKVVEFINSEIIDYKYDGKNEELEIFLN